eukprot:GFUD01060939.1.p1 GENE.GFUD01060939.1~~GFUD01060939.1.p1  ORF type:complete len:112 (+),score=30.61 GFUD01060939.1:177-512(+)
MRFQCRSVNKTLGITVYELARRKLQWVEYEFDYGRNQSSNNFNKLSDKERFEKNRRRRLLKEQESKMKEEDAKSSKKSQMFSLQRRPDSSSKSLHLPGRTSSQRRSRKETQ